MSSELAKLTASPRTDVLPGYTLSPAALADFAQTEAELARAHIATAGAAAVELPDRIGKMIIEAATDDVAAGRFKFGRPAFDAHVVSTTLLPFLLFLTLKREHPATTRTQAEKLITPANEATVSRAVLELFGYNFDKPKAGAPKKEEGASGTGQPSAAPSSTVAEAGATSPA